MTTVFSEENYIPTRSPNPPIHCKIMSSHQNLINSFNYPTGTMHRVFGQNTPFGSIDRVQKSFFDKNLTFKMLV